MERVREGLGKGGSFKGNFGQPSPGANIKFGCPTYHHHRKLNLNVFFSEVWAARTRQVGSAFLIYASRIDPLPS